MDEAPIQGANLRSRTTQAAGLGYVESGPLGRRTVPNIQNAARVGFEPRDARRQLEQQRGQLPLREPDRDWLMLLGRLRTLSALLWLLGVGPSVLLGQGADTGEKGMVPFSIPTVGYWRNATDMSWLNETPAGKHGFVQVLDGHFADGRGERLRFLGGGLIRHACFPTHEMAELLAKRLAMTGFNLVRVHHIDTTWAPRGIWDKRYQDKQHLDPGQLERFDYLVARLKEQGVYLNINLHVSRKFTEADGFPAAGKLPGMDKGVDHFESRMIELQKAYARDLLTHHNPYTGLRYVDDPVVAFVEINNENSLLGMVLANKLPRLPEEYEGQLTAHWNRFLRERYDSTEALRRRWGQGVEPPGPELLTNGDFADGGEGWGLQTRELMTPTVEQTGPDGARCLKVHCAGPGPIAWSMQMHQIGLDLEDGKPYTFEFRIRAGKPGKVAAIARLDHAHPDTGRFEVVGLNRSIELNEKWQQYRFTFIARNPRPNGNRIGFTFPNEEGDIWLADLSLRRGGQTGGQKPGESLEAGTVSRPLFDSSLPQEWRDWVECVNQIELDYYLDMKRFLRNELGVKCPIIGSQASYGGIGGMVRESLFDYCDMHAYWQHPRFPRKAWDGKDWEVANSPMVAAPESSITLRLAQHRLDGKPFVVSEFNHPNPSWYAAECWPVMASFAALQDWDGLIIHNYVNYGCEEWPERRWGHFFDTSTDPQKMPFLPAAAIMFRRGAVRPLSAEKTLQIPVEHLAELMATGRSQVTTLWHDLLPEPSAALSARLSTAFAAGAGQAGVTIVEDSRPADVRTPQIAWRVSGEREALYTVDTPEVKAAVGFLSGQSVALAGVTFGMGATATGFAAVTLVALDGVPVETSQRLLLTAVGRARNAGWAWREDGKMLTNWGGNPTLVEVLPLTLSLATRARSVSAYALDGAGNRVNDIPCELTEGRVSFSLSPAHKTVWVEFDGRE